MNFQFPLEKLLELKLQEEKQAFAELAGWREKLRLSRERLNDLETNYSCYLRSLVENSKLPAGKYVSYARFFPMLQEGINKEKTTGDLIEGEIEKLMAGLVALIKERQVLEKLKEKRQEDFLLEAGKKEQLQIDEIALSRYFSAGIQWR